ncbi:hypothetical protein LTSEJOH_1662 [Salmonella enterica subsp. enterica serovar Johannesburg str. S5-703]|nr:hypothetical protein LTSEJOH_1662 [Salmonella enterica subsp. enterica serovar Johannesburg str. S5-703]
MLSAKNDLHTGAAEQTVAGNDLPGVLFRNLAPSSSTKICK